MAVPPDDKREDLNERTLIDQSALDEAPAPPRPAARPSAPAPAPAPAPALAPPGDEGDEATRMIDVLVDEQPPAPAPRPGPGVAHLVCVAGKDLGRSFPIADASTLVGRGLDCTIILSDPSVSRRHFNILRTPEGYRLVDLGSGNGTRLNGVVVPENSLEEGALIDVGVTTLRFGLGPAPVADPRPAPAAPAAGPAPPAAPRQASAAGTLTDMPAAPPRKGGGWRLPLLVLGVLLVLVLGFLVADKFAGLGVVFGTTEAEVARLSADAEVLLEDERWREAAELLERAQALDPQREDLERELRRARREARASEDWEAAQEAKRDGDPAEARSRLEAIGDKSAYYERAQGLLASLAPEAPVTAPADSDAEALAAFDARRFDEAAGAFRALGAVPRAEAVGGFAAAYQEGTAFARESRHAEAVMALEEALRLHRIVGGGLEAEVRGLLVGSLVARAQHALEGGRSGDAAIDARRAAALEPSEPTVATLRDALVAAGDAIEQEAKDRLNARDEAGAMKLFEVLVWLFPPGNPKHEFAKGMLPAE